MSSGASAKRIADAGRLAWLPLVFLAEQQLQVDAGVEPADGSAAYREVMVTGLWVYQLHSYQRLVSRHFGAKLAAQVQSRQQAIMENEQPGAGAAIAAALQLVDSAVDVMPPGSGPGQAPAPLSVERSVALALLYGLPESPDYRAPGRSTDRKVYPRQVCQKPGMDERFAQLLDRGQQQLLRAFAPIFAGG